MGEKKVVRQFRIAESIETELTELSIETGKSKTAILEDALRSYFGSMKQDENEKIAELFLKKFDEKYAAYHTRIRLGVRTAEINSQIVMEILNTLLMLKGTKRAAFTSISEMESPIITASKETVKARIEKAKQKKDHANAEGSGTKF